MTLLRAGSAALSPALDVVLTAAPQLLPTASRHSAFPSLAQTPDGSLELAWRGGTDHAAARDGSIQIATSRDHGLTYAGEHTILSGRDDRDPSVSYVTVNGQSHEYLTYFTGSASLAAEGAYVSRDGAAGVRIDTLPYAAISAPVIQLPDGRLGTAFYGRRAGETIDTAWMGWSADGGQTWSTNRILNDGASHAEPVLLVRGTATYLIARGGSDSLVMRTSPDSGRTWGTPRLIVGACTGRPSGLVTAAGTMILVCRGTLPAVNAQVAYSVDGGTSWRWGPTVLRAPAGSPIGMTYAAMVEVLPGVVHVVVGMEQADGSSQLYRGWLAEVA